MCQCTPRLILLGRQALLLEQKVHEVLHSYLNADDLTTTRIGDERGSIEVWEKITFTVSITFQFTQKYQIVP